MATYQNQYYSAAALFRMSAAMHAAAEQLRDAAKALHAWLDDRRRAAIAFHEFERMSDHSLRDIGLIRADVLRAAWGVERGVDPLEACR